MIILRKCLVLCKVESPEGTDAVPTTAADALLVDSVSIEPHVEHVERPGLHMTVGQLASVPGARWYDIEIEFELKGAGHTTGTCDIPDWAPLARSACMTQGTPGATLALTPASPRSAADVTSTIWVYRDGVCFKARGCRGSLKLTATAGKRCMATWSGKGLMSTAGTADLPGDVTFPTSSTLDAELPGVALNMSMAIGGLALVAESLSIDLSNEITDRPSFNSQTGLAGFAMTGRNPSLTLNPEATTEATATMTTDAGALAGWWTVLATRAATMAFTATLNPGAAQGQIVTLAAPKLQIRGVKIGERNGYQTYEIDCGLRESTGNDELSITIS